MAGFFCFQRVCLVIVLLEIIYKVNQKLGCVTAKAHAPLILFLV